jgi:hypothetical protein
MAFASNSPSSRAIFSINEVSTSGPKTYTFTVPQDCQSLLARIYLDSAWNASGTCKVTIQTSEDGGTTWRDVSGTTIGGSTVAADFPKDRAHFIPIGVGWGSAKGAANYVGSVQASTAALAAVNSSAVGNVTGLPMLGTLGRVQFDYTTTITTGGVHVDIYAPTTDVTS